MRVMRYTYPLIYVLLKIVNIWGKGVVYNVLLMESINMKKMIQHFINHSKKQQDRKERRLQNLNNNTSNIRLNY